MPRPLSCTGVSLLLMVIVVLCSASRLLAQVVSMPTDGAYHPGAIVPLRIDAADAGPVRVRATDALGIDWDAPGRTSVVVPWVVWRGASGEIEVAINDRKQMLSLSARPREERIVATDPIGQAILDRTGPLDRFGGINPHAYAPTYDFSPGRPERQRLRIVTWSIVVLLALGATALAPRKHRAPAMLVVAAVLCGAIAWSVKPALAQRAVIVRSSDFVDTWIYHAGAPGDRVRERLTGDAWVFPPTARDLGSVDPVLHVDSAGDAIELSGSIPSGGFLGFVKRGRDAEPAGAEIWASPMFTIRLYGVAGTTGEDRAIRLPR